jgi:hypothetical protein
MNLRRRKLRLAAIAGGKHDRADCCRLRFPGQLNGNEGQGQAAC